MGNLEDPFDDRNFLLFSLYYYYYHHGCDILSITLQDTTTGGIWQKYIRSPVLFFLTFLPNPLASVSSPSEVNPRDARDLSCFLYCCFPGTWHGCCTQ